MLLWIVFVVAYNHQLLYSVNILNDKNVIENTENILCTHFHFVITMRNVGVLNTVYQ